MSNFRQITLLIGFIFFAAAIAARLFYWQVINYNQFAEAAESQYTSTLEIGAQRGKIFSSDGEILVSNETSYLVFATLSDLRKKFQESSMLEVEVKKAIEELSPILLDEKLLKYPEPEKISTAEKEQIIKSIKNKLSESFNKTKLVWVPLAYKISEKTKNKIEKLNLGYIGFEKQAIRFYPEDFLAPHILGFVGENEAGVETGYLGLEGYYNDELKGKPGKLIQELDAQGRPILVGEAQEFAPQNGRDLVLTLDRSVQYIVEKHLEEGVKRYGANSGSIVVLSPKTGGVLAMANYPDYKPSKWEHFSETRRRNLSIADVYEPGSTFKVITMAAALNEKVVEPSTICPCKGPLKIGVYEIRTWNNEYHSNSTMTQVLQHSDNVGAAFASQKLGVDKFLKYIRDFGIGRSTDIDLQGEEYGLVKEAWYPIDLATGAFGQGLSTTALQMTAAVGAIANDGILMKPYIVQKIIGEERSVEIQPKSARQVINKETATILKEMMIAAVEGGEARRIIPKGYRIAGKTGTAQIPIAGHYDPRKTVASFVGFGPVEDPKFVMLVKFNQPSTSPYGSETAAPLFFEITKDLFAYWGVPPSK